MRFLKTILILILSMLIVNSFIYLMTSIGIHTFDIARWDDKTIDTFFSICVLLICVYFLFIFSSNERQKF